MKRRTQRQQDHVALRESKAQQQQAEAEARARAKKARRKQNHKAAVARDRAVRAKFGTTSILSYGASDQTRIEKRRVARRIAEERNRYPVVVKQGCTCPRQCDLHPFSGT